MVLCTVRQKLGIASHQCSLHSLTGVKIDEDRILRALSKNGATPSFVIKYRNHRRPSSLKVIQMKKMTLTSLQRM